MTSPNDARDVFQLNPHECPPDTLECAKRDVDASLAQLEQWADAIDNKMMAAFGVGALILGVVPGVRGGPIPLGGILALAAAVGCWIWLAWHAVKAIGPTPWRVVPPENLVKPDWLLLDAPSYQLFRMEYAVEQYRDTVKGYRTKRERMRLTLILLFVEAVALTVVAVVS